MGVYVLFVNLKLVILVICKGLILLSFIVLVIIVCSVENRKSCWVWISDSCNRL